MPTPLEDVLSDAQSMRELGYKMPSDDQIRAHEKIINEFRAGGMTICDITNHLQSKILLGPDR